MANLTKYQVKVRLKKGDEVVVLTGRAKGQTGKIDRIERKKDRVYLVGVNLAKRHTKPNLGNQEGGIIEKVAPLNISNVSLIDSKTKKPTRVGYKLDGAKKTRVARRSGTTIA